ncbi:DNA helicase [Tubulinosema ratisbonensis]|uniref:DNA helicase n=1 Tax=Tubulinosema ratisbonensis TaxID=291195 RepID=A0A437AN42_9MICR|nr:DNA helicase [Tubulinosema ratisbonensis]
MIKYILFKNKRVLVCTNSNSALDNLAVHFLNYDFIKYGSKTKSKIESTSKRSKLIFSTLYQSLKINKLFDYVIIDEGSFCNDLELLSALCKGKKIVLSGDPFQLNLEKMLNEERIFLKNIKEINNLFEKIKIKKIILNKSFRSSEKMIEWSNKTFYNSVIQSDILPNSFDKQEILFVDTYNDTYESEKKSKINLKEAEIAVKLQEKYGGVIITMYDAQAKLLSEMTNNVHTVDSFQGKESDTVIVSFVRTEKTGFLKNLKRINVAVTRAKKRLIIICDGKMLMESELRSFINYLYENAYVVDYHSVMNDELIN